MIEAVDERDKGANGRFYSLWIAMKRDAPVTMAAPFDNTHHGAELQLGRRHTHCFGDKAGDGVMAEAASEAVVVEDKPIPLQTL
jgi:hypothetical protein